MKHTFIKEWFVWYNYTSLWSHFPTLTVICNCCQDHKRLHRSIMLHTHHQQPSCVSTSINSFGLCLYNILSSLYESLWKLLKSSSKFRKSANSQLFDETEILTEFSSIALIYSSPFVDIKSMDFYALTYSCITVMSSKMKRIDTDPELFHSSLARRHVLLPSHSRMDCLCGLFRRWKICWW